MKHYTEETRREVIRLYFEEGLGARRITKRLDLSSTALVRQWVFKYMEYGEDSFTQKCPRIDRSECSLYTYRQYCSHLEKKNQEILAENKFLKIILNADVTGKYGLIAQASGESISMLCRLGNVSRSGYYRWRAAQNKNDRRKGYSDLLSIIQEIYALSKGTYGYRRIDKALRARGIIVNHKRLQRILRENDLQSKLYVKRKLSWKTKENVDNLLRQSFTAERPNEKWVTDFTFFSVEQRSIQLMCIMDLYDGKIIYHAVRRSFTATDTIRCVKQALELCCPAKELILHSDRGAQFKSKTYSDALKKLGVKQSMSRSGNCFDNARIESFFGHLKVELPILYPYSTISELKNSIDSFIEYYNNDRIKSC